MGVRYQTTVYNEKKRKIIISIKDTNYSGTVGTFDTTNISLQYDSESKQGEERFTPIIGSKFNLQLLINSQALQTLMTDIGLAVEGRFTIQISSYKADNTTIAFNWYGYIVTDLIEFEDVPIELGFIASIQAIDGIAWLKTLLYKSEVGPYISQDTVVQHILNCLNQLDFVQSELVANDLPILHTIFNWHEDSISYSAANDFALRTAIQHRAFYHTDTKGNYIYKSCYDVLNIICTALGARLIFSGSQYWLIQVNEYNNSPKTHRYFKYKAFGDQVSGTFTDDFTLLNLQSNLNTSKLLRLSGGRWSYYSALKNTILRYNHNAKRNLMAGIVYNYITNNDGATVQTGTLDATSPEAKLSYTGILYQRSLSTAGPGFVPHMFVYAVKVASVIDAIPLQTFSPTDWTFGSGWSELSGKLFAVVASGTAQYNTENIISGKYYYVKIKVELTSGELRLRLGGVTKIITSSGDYDYKIYTTSTQKFILDSISTPKVTATITSLQVKKESKYLKRNITFTNGFNFQLTAASWETLFYEWEFNTDLITQDGTEIINKTISFDTLAIPETGEYIWEMRLKEVRDESGTDIKADYTIEYYLTNNYLEFIPDGTLQGQADIKEFGNDNDDKSSVSYDNDTYIGDGPSATTTGALRVLNSSGQYIISDGWKFGNNGTAKPISQLLINEVIKGQLTPRLRMVDMPFQNLSLDQPYLPHLAIEYSSGYYVFERGSYNLNTDIWNGDFYKIEY
jgi:hypothetical protein